MSSLSEEGHCHEVSGCSPMMTGLLTLGISRRQQKFKTFPDTLVVHMKKFQLVNWMPTKLGKFDFPCSLVVWR